MAKCNLGKVKFKTMPISGRPTLRLRGDLFELSAGGASWFALHLLACLLACVKGHFARLFSSLFSLSTLPLVSIPLIGFSVTVPLVVAARRVAMDTSFLVPRCCPAPPTFLRNHLPSSSIVDEFNLLWYVNHSHIRLWSTLFACKML